MIRVIRALACTLACLTTGCVAAAAVAQDEPGGGALPIAGSFVPPMPHPLSRLLSPLHGVPANGSLLLDSWGNETPPASFEFASPMHRAGGTIRLIDGFLVVTPTEVLRPDLAYDVRVTLRFATQPAQPFTMTFGPAWQPTLPDVEITLAVERVETPAMPVCCTNLPGLATRQPSCFPTRTTRQIQVQSTFTSQTAPERLSQFLFRIRAAGSTLATPLYRPFERTGGPITWVKRQAEYCLALEAIDITSGRAEPYADSSCVAHGELGELEPAAIPLDPKHLDRAVCTVAPPGFEMRWCEINQPACEADPAAIGCENFDHACRGGPPPVFMPPSPPAAVPSTNFPGPKTLAGASAAGSGGISAHPRKLPTRPDAGFGCSAIARPHPGALAAIAGVLLSLLLRRRRRRAA